MGGPRASLPLWPFVGVISAGGQGTGYGWVRLLAHCPKEPPASQPLTTEDALSPQVLLLTQTLGTRQDSLSSPFSWSDVLSPTDMIWSGGKMVELITCRHHLFLCSLARSLIVSSMRTGTWPILFAAVVPVPRTVLDTQQCLHMYLLDE